MPYCRKLKECASRPWFAYVTLFLFQLKIIWGMWNYRDLTSGDTSSYFCDAYLWFESMTVDIIWSPLYTAFYGSMLHLSTDAYVATILHRLIIVLTVALMVLCLMRKLLPAPLAWLIAAWWAVLPINFNPLYEVHLFAVIPVLAAYLVILSTDSRWARGGAIAILFATSILVRNELNVATAVLALICMGWEFYEAKKGGKFSGAQALACLKGYGVPLLLAFLVCFFFYTRSYIQFPKLTELMKPKHTLNMAQVYAFGYQQRHPEWTKSPWTESADLMQHDFGAPLLPLGEMIKRNRRAIFANMLWNISLTPSGIQVLLFNAASGSMTPDYGTVILHSRSALALSILVGTILFFGMILLYRERTYWWKHWLKDRLAGWLAMLSVVAVAPLIVLTQRPRPSYLFSVSIFLMALTGMCLVVFLRRWPALRRLSAAMPAIMILFPMLVPSYFLHFGKDTSRELLTMYEHLKPFEKIIAFPGNKLLVKGYGYEIKCYLAHNRSGGQGSETINDSFLKKLSKSMPLESVLDQKAGNLFYVNDSLWSQLESNPFCSDFLQHPEAAGWEKIGFQDAPESRWMLLRKKVRVEDDPLTLMKLNAQNDIGPASDLGKLYNNGFVPTDGLFLGKGWHDLEHNEAVRFRWANNNAELIITHPSGNKQQLLLDLEPGPGAGTQPVVIQVMDAEGAIIDTITTKVRTTAKIHLPKSAAPRSIIRLHVDGGGLPAPNGDPRILNFRVFQFHWGYELPTDP